MSRVPLKRVMALYAHKTIQWPKHLDGLDGDPGLTNTVPTGHNYRKLADVQVPIALEP